MIKNVFISHIHKDDDRVRALKDLLKSKGVEVRDGSIDSSKPNAAANEQYIKSNILAPRIDWSGAFIALIGPGTHTSEWVEWEIDYAHKKDKTIIGVWDQGAKDSDLPEGLDKYADAIVGWNGDSIVDALEGKETWSVPSGRRRERPIDRHNC